MRRLGATHALVDPMYYARLVPLLVTATDQFTRVYDDGARWAVFELTQR
jgi:hypothetical protein